MDLQKVDMVKRHEEKSSNRGSTTFPNIVTYKIRRIPKYKYRLSISCEVQNKQKHIQKQQPNQTARSG